MTTLFTSVLAAIVVQVIPPKISKILGAIIIVGCIGLTFNYFKPSKIFYKSDNDYLSRMFADRTVTGTKSTVSQDYLNWSEDYLPLPGWTSTKPSTLPQSKIIGEKNVSVTNIQETSPIWWTGNIDAKTDGKITFFAYYFPGWNAELDGKKVETQPGKPYGQIEVMVSKGVHKIEFFWKETPLRKIADYVSLISLVIITAFKKTPRK